MHLRMMGMLNKLATIQTSAELDERFVELHSFQLKEKMLTLCISILKMTGNIPINRKNLVLIKHQNWRNSVLHWSLSSDIVI